MCSHHKITWVCFSVVGQIMKLTEKTDLTQVYTQVRVVFVFIWDLYINEASCSLIFRTFPLVFCPIQQVFKYIFLLMLKCI